MPKFDVEIIEIRRTVHKGRVTASHRQEIVDEAKTLWDQDEPFSGPAMDLHVDTMQDEYMVKIDGTTTVSNPCPKCGAELEQDRNALVCPKEDCDYWREG